MKLRRVRDAAPEMPPFIQPAGFTLPNVQYADDAKISQKNWVIGKQVKAAKLVRWVG